MAKLNEKQTRFCAEYLRDFNATQAAIRAGYSKRSAYSIGWDLLKKPEIQTELTRHREAALAEGAMQFDEACGVLSQIARGRVADYLSEDGRIDPDRIRGTNPAAVQYVKSAENHAEIRLRDPVQAIERLAKLLGWDKQPAGTDPVGDLIAWIRGLNGNNQRSQ